jgi:hypothetical protein
MCLPSFLLDCYHYIINGGHSQYKMAATFFFVNFFKVHKKLANDTASGCSLPEGREQPLAF